MEYRKYEVYSADYEMNIIKKYLDSGVTINFFSEYLVVGLPRFILGFESTGKLTATHLPIY